MKKIIVLLGLVLVLALAACAEDPTPTPAPEKKSACGRSPGRGGLQMSPDGGERRATHAAPRFVAPMRRVVPHEHWHASTPAPAPMGFCHAPLTAGLEKGPAPKTHQVLPSR